MIDKGKGFCYCDTVVLKRRGLSDVCQEIDTLNMSDDNLPDPLGFSVRKREKRGLAGSKKINILFFITLALLVGLFFSSHFSLGAPPESASWPDQLSSDVLDPLGKIGKGYVGNEKEEGKICREESIVSEKSGDKINSEEEEELGRLLLGYPIEKMIPFMAKKDKVVSAFLVGIAKKESDWGKHVPRKNGRDCYNYWGFKGGYNLTSSGYSCFDNPEQAIEMVGGRIEELVGKKIDTPEKMVVWKCGSSCAGHDPAGVRKWISDVSKYFYKLNS